MLLSFLQFVAKSFLFIQAYRIAQTVPRIIEITIDTLLFTPSIIPYRTIEKMHANRAVSATYPAIVLHGRILLNWM